MTESIPIDNRSEVGCASDAGAYYLSKTYFKVEVARKRQKSKPSVTWGELKGIAAQRKPDRKHGFCIDYLASATTDEKVFVRKSNNYLLRLISTEAVDQSAYIVKALIHTFFTSLSSAESFRSIAPDDTEDLGTFSVEYDPFDPVMSAVMNDSLSQFGLCLILENQTFDPSSATIGSYCNNPKRTVSGQQRFVEAVARKEERLSSQKNIGGAGIFYRPRLSYNYYLFVKDQGKTAWKLRETATVQLENTAPIINVGVDRAFFANRRTALVFDDGSLTNVCIYKTSELAEISTIPLTIAKDIAALPTNVVQMRIDQTNNFAKLANAQDALLQTQEEHLKVLQGGTPGGSAGGSSQQATTTNLAFEDVGNPKSRDSWPTDWDKSICPFDASGRALTTPGGFLGEVTVK